MPRVSIVIPVYNAAEFLPRTLGDLSVQTLADFEVICVDDGSSDQSAAIVAEQVSRDPRFRLITQKNSGSAAARNRGIDEAKGEYLLLLDADDAFEPELLQVIATRLDETGADLCIYNATLLTDDGALGAGRYLRHALLPESPVFAPAQVADRLFQLVTPAVWLRMFRRRFLVDSGIRFPPGQIPDDLCFTADTLAATASITVADEVLVRYRVGHLGAATSRWDERPLVFEEALDDLADRLAARGQLDVFRHSYQTLCLDAMMHVLAHLTTDAAHELVVGEIDSRLLAKYGLDTMQPRSVPLRKLRRDLELLQGRTRAQPRTEARPAPSALRRLLGPAVRRLRERGKS